MTELDDQLRRLDHDLRTPLVIIDGFARLLADERPLRDADRIEFAARIRAAAADLRSIVEETRLAVARRSGDEVAAAEAAAALEAHAHPGGGIVEPVRSVSVIGHAAVRGDGAARGDAA